MDKFSEWLEKNSEHYALIDRSYKKVLQKDKSKNNNIQVNTELATYGDIVLKLAICSILWREDISKLSEIKKKYEEDENLVKIIAQYYHLLDYMLDSRLQRGRSARLGRQLKTGTKSGNSRTRLGRQFKTGLERTLRRADGRLADYGLELERRRRGRPRLGQRRRFWRLRRSNRTHWIFICHNTHLLRFTRPVKRPSLRLLWL